MATSENTRSTSNAINQTAFELIALCRGAYSLLDNHQNSEDACSSQRLMLMAEDLARKIVEASDDVRHQVCS
jgi:hypothetical protein